ncbi:hypothetical protein CPJCM30710_04470 [Clostridium polyendosporum]|uniref:DUF378 domain-containing protein n=1 Tax=Clostridium polyendosporum TaxID=69208 RepID=A0A919VFS1_9CLOT|nr:DUF378 domain-containing protein [Clostridium polyendosporum]GIM27781.1 hypothetical protein CPJCM30710_04470 [Clostridium polyendosporum]
MYKLNSIDKLSFLLVIIGAINWGLIGLFNLNVVRVISFNSYAFERIIYILVFASSINLIALIIKSKAINDTFLFKK